MIRKCRHYKVFWWYRGDGTDTTHFATAINFTNVNIPPIQKKPRYFYIFPWGYCVPIIPFVIWYLLYDLFTVCCVTVNGSPVIW